MAATPVGMKRFYAILVAVAVLGLGALGYLLAKPATVSIPANVTVTASDTAGFHGYVKGAATAPVEITEFADFQCPFCQTFATLQMPTIEQRLIDTGRLRWRYRDFPLQQHPFSRLAAHSAACADDQGKYWAQHQRIYEGQSEWATARDAVGIFRRYAKENGLDVTRYDDCMTAGKFAGRIQASYEEGVRLGVNSTPTLLVGGRLYQGRFDSDAITRLVDSLAPHATQ
ncbi:MAG TPA: thioredoxin domain-containing protein [Gemmatimonadales bacterium]|jgi:protein-disulfide isomerase|nr:thioredoxin domain-containing protein [Gemmatimonadales bacterium]